MASEKILLTNNRGEDIAYDGVENILVRTTEDGITQSGQQNFARGEAIEGVEINLSLNDGDQMINAPEGKLVKSAIIKKPDTLIPENIAKDVEIAGVIGTLTGGSGGSGSGSSTEKDIFPLQTVDGFQEDTVDFIGSSLKTLPEPFEIKEGETYFVKWDGAPYTCKGIAASLNDINYIYLGNGSILGYEGNNEPFAIIYIVEYGMVQVIAFNDLNTSHNIRVYQKTGRIEYTFDDSGNIIAVKGIGLREIPRSFMYNIDTIISVDLGECPDVTTINNDFCGYCNKLEEVIFPASITSMGSGVLSDCTALKTIRFLGTYSQWISMDKSNYFGANATVYINGEPLAKDSIVIPDDVTHIGSYAFAYSTYAGTVTIPDSITSIGKYAFYYCKSITSVEIPDTVTRVEDGLFHNCHALESVNLHDAITYIGGMAFYYCQALETVVIPDSVTTIGNTVFTNCKALTSITFGSGITNMGSGLLSYCDKLASITFKEGMTVIGEGMLQYSTSNTAKFIYLKSIVIPASIKKIGQNAFKNASKLTSATFVDPNGWYVSTSSTATSGTNLTLTDASTAATYLRSTHSTKYWFNTD